MTRITTVQQQQDRAGKLPDPVEGQNVPTDFFVPGVGVGDVDRAIFDLFEERLHLETSSKQRTTKVPTIFAGGERFALVKENSPPRDRNGTLVLPLVSIRRSSLEQSEIGVIAGRGLGQDTGDLVIRKRLSERDPKFQALLNRLQLQNQDNIAHENNAQQSARPEGAQTNRVASRRIQPKSLNTFTGELLADDLGKNIFEIITAPFPHFYTAFYEITFWAQYQQHMNRLIERFMTSYDAQGNQFKLTTDKGYWFVGYVDDEWNSEDNFTDYTGEERFVRYKFTMRVPAYLWAMERKGQGVPFRRFLSAPQISFELSEGAIPAPRRSEAPVGSGDIDKFALSDVRQLDKRGNPVESTRKLVDRVEDVVPDPFSEKDKVRYIRILDRNSRKGETVMSKRLIRKLDDINL